MFKKTKKIIDFLFISYWLYQLNISKNKMKNGSKLNDDFEFHILKSDELKYFEKINIQDKYTEIYRNRLNDTNYKCFCIIDKNSNKLAYYSWINMSNTYYCKEINKTLKLKDKNACLFEDDNTIIEYRNKGLHKFVMEKRIKFCSENKINTIYILIHILNKPALKTVNKYNFRRKNIPITFRKGSIKYILNKLNA